MPATAITPVKTTRCDLDIATPVQATEAASDNTNGNIFANSGREFVVGRNSTGGALTIKVSDKNGVAGTAQSVPAAKSVVIGPFRVDKFNDTSGNVTVQTSGSGLNLYVVTLDHAGVLAPSQS